MTATGESTPVVQVRLSQVLAALSHTLDLDAKSPYTSKHSTRVAAYARVLAGELGLDGGFAWTAATHHEKLDGTGYPWNLKDRQLDLAARVLAVADVYDATTSTRPYREGMSHEEAVRLLEGERGPKLCDRVVASAGSLKGSL